jgi:hypothetical protein
MRWPTVTFLLIHLDDKDQACVNEIMKHRKEISTAQDAVKWALKNCSMPPDDGGWIIVDSIPEPVPARPAWEPIDLPVGWHTMEKIDLPLGRHHVGNYRLPMKGLADFEHSVVLSPDTLDWLKKI